MSPPSWKADRWCNAQLSAAGEAALELIVRRSSLERAQVLEALLLGLNEDKMVEVCRERVIADQEAGRVMRRFK